MKIKDMLDLEHTIAAKLFEGKTYPWEVLGDIGDFVKELGKTLDPEVYNMAGEGIWIAKDAKIFPTATLIAPVIIDCGAEVRACQVRRDSVYCTHRIPDMTRCAASFPAPPASSSLRWESGG